MSAWEFDSYVDLFRAFQTINWQVFENENVFECDGCDVDHYEADAYRSGQIQKWENVGGLFGAVGNLVSMGVTSQTMSNGKIQKLKAKEQQRFHHIFGKQEHKLDVLIKKFGSEEKALNAVQKAANKALKEKKLNPDRNGILPNSDNGDIIDVQGIKVQLIGGKVIGDEVILSSFSRKKL
jgi:hypothetical protein